MSSRVAALVAALAVVAAGGCSEGSDPDPNEFRRTQLLPKPIPAASDPYAATPRIDAGVDASGAQLGEPVGAGVRVPHPVKLAQYGVSLLNGYDRDPRFARAGLANAQALLESAVHRKGEIWFPYNFDFPLHGDLDNTILAPWWSAMAQGLALSLFVRLYEETEDEVWRDRADATFTTLARVHPQDELPVEGPWATFVDPDGWLWFEEYAGNVEPMRVLNGHIVTMYGLHDYWRLTGSKRAARLFDGGATTVKHHVPLLRNPGEPSWYGMRIRDNPAAKSLTYHKVHIDQLRSLALMTGDPEFDELADLLVGDAS